MKRNRYTVRVIFCTAAQAARLEKMLILKLNPRDNEMKYESYAADQRDKAILTDYSEAPVERDAPF